MKAVFAAGCTHCGQLVWFTSRAARDRWNELHPRACTHWPLLGRVWMMLTGRRRWR